MWFLVCIRVFWGWVGMMDEIDGVLVSGFKGKMVVF